MVIESEFLGRLYPFLLSLVEIDEEANSLKSIQQQSDRNAFLPQKLNKELNMNSIP